MVATNVGACPELLYGGAEADQKLGEAGVVTNVNSPEETARAIVELLKRPRLRERMGEVGRERATTYYGRRDVFERYRALYRTLIRESEQSEPLDRKAG